MVLSGESLRWPEDLRGQRAQPSRLEALAPRGVLDPSKPHRDATCDSCTSGIESVMTKSAFQYPPSAARINLTKTSVFR
jgi:hypothetical protein